MNRGAAPPVQRGLARLAIVILLCYAGVALGIGYWQGLQAQALTNDPGDPLVAALRDEPRGRILDARGTVLALDTTVDGVRVRRYPQPAAEPVVGYWSPTLGSSGLEQTYDADLAGLSGTSPVDALLRKFGASAATPLDVVTSLDMRLQADAVKLLGKQKGAIVALDPTTGRVLALASTPSFDPNQLVAPGSGAAYLAGLSAPGNAAPLLDRATQGHYTPGSVFKMVTAVAGLGSGAITAGTTYPDQPAEDRTGFLVDGFRVVDGDHPWTDDTALDLVQATEVSDNIYFAHVGLATGAAALRDWARRLGFEAAIPFDLPTAPSQVTSGGGPLDGFVDDVELANAAYGQGTTAVTPLQMALVAATIGNGGTLMRPTLVDMVRAGSTIVQRTTPQIWQEVLPPAQDQILREAMTGAVESAWGKPIAGSAAIPGVPTAGKTGTAQLGGSGEPHAWFIGFAPAAAPRIAVAVIIEQGGHGGEVAAPLGGQLMGDWLRMSH
ncbi:MAG TPA: penicillin-binding transpeptidase domain-containing protein [Candidatus Baltobacteraceae bacterium]|nr:penicillin-binding transpeptidase domain-containing protein [Candidatus Baltobacteraceae bacterium]